MTGSAEAPDTGEIPGEQGALSIAFDAGWDAALDEAIMVVESADFTGESLAEIASSLRGLRDNQPTGNARVLKKERRARG